MVALRVIILLLSLVGIGLWLRWAADSRVYRWLAIAPITWLVHVALFHSALPLTATALNQWSLAIHLHALILLAAAPLVLLYEARHD